jgi:sigma-B regulation protein RsbU (phosphoserine phosphatase)
VATTPEGEFEFISDLCTVLAEQAELQPILDWIVQKGAQLLGTDECTIKVIKPGAATMLTVVSGSSKGVLEAGAASWPRSLKDLVLGYLHGHPGELATPDLAADDRFPLLRGQPTPARALLAVPLKVDGQVTGMFAASDVLPGRVWSRHHVQLLSIIASHSAIVIEKARLRMEAEKAERNRLEQLALEKELELAHDIQMGLVPDAPLAAGPWQIEGRLIPAHQVGGDFFDYFELDGERAGLVIADVAGKGVPAALLVSIVQSALREITVFPLTPCQVVERLNRTVLRYSAAGKFVTMFYGELDHARGRLRYVNAGHVYPRLRRAAGGVEMLAVGGRPIGMFDDSTYEMAEVALAPGDALLLFTDGIPDALDSLRRFFEEEPVDALWHQYGGEPTTSLLERLTGAVRAHRGINPQNDDETALVISPRRG